METYNILIDGVIKKSAASIGEWTVIAPNRYMLHNRNIDLEDSIEEHNIQFDFKIKYSKVRDKKTYNTHVKACFLYEEQAFQIQYIINEPL